MQARTSKDSGKFHFLMPSGSVTVFCFLFRSSDRYMHIPLISNIDLNKIDNYTAYSDGIL